MDVEHAFSVVQSFLLLHMYYSLVLILLGFRLCALLYVFTLLFFYLSSVNRQTYKAISTWRRLYESNSVVTQFNTNWMTVVNRWKKNKGLDSDSSNSTNKKVYYSFRTHWYGTYRFYWKSHIKFLLLLFFVFIHYLQNTSEITCFPVAKHVRKSRSTKSNMVVWCRYAWIITS